MERVLNKILGEHQREQGNVISLLQRIQDAYGFISEEHVFWFSEKLDVPASRFFGVITFYPKFRTKPVGKNTLTVCCGAACHIKGGDKILDAARDALTLPPGEDTTPDLRFTVQKATCIGACNIAPVVILNKQVHGGVDPVKVRKLLTGYEREEFLGYL
jgi:NADH:ubiquinone oxidoreductase subunit E